MSPAPFDATDFNAIMQIHGENLTVQHRAEGAVDALNEPTMAASGAPVTIRGVVQDVSTQDLKRVSGVWRFGDKVLFTRAVDVALVPTDRISFGGATWQVVTETTEETAGTVIYREYLIRRTSSG